MKNIKITILQRVFKKNNALFYFEYPNKATNLDTGKQFEDNRVYNSHQQHRILPDNYHEAECEYLQNQEYYEAILLKYLKNCI